MARDFEFAGLAAPGVGIWPAVSIEQVPLAPRDAVGAAAWLARLFWPDDFGGDDGFREVVRQKILGAPEGVGYFLSSAIDLCGALREVGGK